MNRRQRLFVRLIRAAIRLPPAQRQTVTDAWQMWARRHDWRTY